jgi:GTP pyrophosphokinase
MHRVAEEGIAAHWAIKTATRGGSREDERSHGCVTWWSGNRRRGSDDFMSTLKVDLYPEEVYTFLRKEGCFSAA